MDTWSGSTTSGTPLDNCMTATQAYMYKHLMPFNGVLIILNSFVMTLQDSIYTR